MQSVENQGAMGRRTQPFAQSAVIHAGHSSRSARHDEEKRAHSIAIAITTSLLFVLFASALLIGGRVAIGTIWHRSDVASGPSSMGQMLYAMPDGQYCRHFSFDNATGVVNEGGIERCPDAVEGPGGQSSTGFQWGGGH